MSKWVTMWGNATSIANHKVVTYAKDITLRYLVWCPFGGSKLRLHFSNFCGTEPVTLSCVTLAKADGDGTLLGEIKKVTFSQNESVTIRAGEELFSDEFECEISGGQIAVSIYLGGFTQMRSAVEIFGPHTKGYYSLGNMSGVRELPIDFTRHIDTYYFLTGVDILTAEKNRAVILYGDSITAQSWPDWLMDMLYSRADNDTAIIRRAASGTRILREYTCLTYESYGLSGEHRFEREISTISGANSVVIQQGINDIIHPVGVEVNPFRPMSDLPSVQELQAGIQRYIDFAKGRGLKVFLGTLLPIYGWRTYAEFREDMRNEFNDFLRGNAGVDGVIDFDISLRDSENPKAFKKVYDSGDHLHPSEEGYKVMARSCLEKLS